MLSRIAIVLMLMATVGSMFLMSAEAARRPRMRISAAGCTNCGCSNGECGNAACACQSSTQTQFTSVEVQEPAAVYSDCARATSVPISVQVQEPVALYTLPRRVVVAAPVQTGTVTYAAFDRPRLFNGSGRRPIRKALGFLFRRGSC